jgi:starvation-inducible DNA-binding protein
MELDNGLSKEDRKSISKELKTILGTSYSLYVKSQKFHWNVKGELFQILHEELETIYEDLADFNDQVAERVRALGFRAPGSFSEFSSLSEIEESREQDLSTREMIKTIIKDYEALIKLMRSALDEADDCDDSATDDLLSGKLLDFEKQVWMLRSMLD